MKEAVRIEKQIETRATRLASVQSYSYRKKLHIFKKKKKVSHSYYVKYVIKIIIQLKIASKSSHVNYVNKLNTQQNIANKIERMKLILFANYAINLATQLIHVINHRMHDKLRLIASCVIVLAILQQLVT